MEDAGAIALCPASWSLDSEVVLVNLDDGVGGQAGGDYCSSLTRSIVTSSLLAALTEPRSEPPHPDEIAAMIQRAIRLAHAEVIEQQNSPGLTRMACTTATAIIANGLVIASWVGDSRLYLFRPNYGLVQLTRDHNPVAEQVALGELSSSDRHRQPDSHVIQRAIGSPGSSAGHEPDTTIHTTRPGDVILATTDGVTDVTSHAELTAMLAESTETDEPAPEMAHQLTRSAIQRGGQDNASVALARLGGRTAASTDAPAATGGVGYLQSLSTLFLDT